jgi:hypothetical protein
MKKEDLIKKAAERGIAIDETQAEKYVNLSDEELANIAGGGSNLCGFKHEVNGKNANSCRFYVPGATDSTTRSCYNCMNAVAERKGDGFVLYCTKEEAWQ